jgi:hypothetical protein
MWLQQRFRDLDLPLAVAYLELLRRSRRTLHLQSISAIILGSLDLQWVSGEELRTTPCRLRPIRRQISWRDHAAPEIANAHTAHFRNFSIC